MAMDLPALQRAIGEQGLDGWLLYDFRAQNPTAVAVLGLGGHMLTRRWFYLIPARGTPTLLLHAIELLSFPSEIPGERRSYASWGSLHDELRRLIADAGGHHRLAMEYCPMAAIPYASRVDAGTLELVRSLGADVVSSADLVQQFLARYSPAQVESHVRAMKVIEAAKDGAFELIGRELRARRQISETDVQRFLLERFRDGDVTADHAPIVAVNGHAGDPHYVPSEKTPTPIRKGDTVLIDLWAVEPRPGAVYADITWMAFCGDSPSEKAASLFRIAADGRDLGLETIRRAWGEGRTLQGWQVDRVVRDHISAHGYGERFVHRTGHSIGTTAVHGDGANLDDLETHDTRTLVEGSVFSIEPGIYMADEGVGVRTEIDVVMTAAGPQVYSAIQQDLVRIAV
jgi:Xaa-Pro aminopeptidase